MALGLTLLAFGCGARTRLDDAPLTGATASAGASGGGSGSGGSSVLTLASGLQSAGCVAVDRESVYWVTGAPGPDFPGAVMKAPLDGGPVTTLAAGNGFPWPCHIALDRTSLYWGGASAVGVRKVPLRGGAVTTIVTSGYASGGLVVDATSVYFTNAYDGVAKAPLAGGPIHPLALPGGSALAIDPQHVYWTTRTGGQSTDVLSATLDGGVVRTLASSPLLADALAVDAHDVYVVEYSGGTVLALPIGGGPTRSVTSGLFLPGVSALDDQNVYVGDSSSLTRVPKTGGTATVLANDTRIFSVAVDASSVYWTNGEAVKKISKR